MTLSFIAGPIIALIVFVIFITDKWEVIKSGDQDTDRDEIYNRYHYLQKQKIRCKVVRENPQNFAENIVLKLLVLNKDIEKAKDSTLPQ